MIYSRSQASKKQSSNSAIESRSWVRRGVNRPSNAPASSKRSADRFFISLQWKIPWRSRNFESVEEVKFCRYSSTSFCSYVTSRNVKYGRIKESIRAPPALSLAKFTRSLTLRTTTQGFFPLETLFNLSAALRSYLYSDPSTKLSHPWQIANFSANSLSI